MEVIQYKILNFPPLHLQITLPSVSLSPILEEEIASFSTKTHSALSSGWILPLTSAINDLVSCISSD